MAKGIDCATPLNATTAKAIKAAGYDFVCRYYGHAGSRKLLTKAEAEAITAAGIKIVSIWETTANRALSGAAGGAADGKAAREMANSIGQPHDSAIYFAVDFDAQPSQMDVIEQYAKAFDAAITEYSSGSYGSYSVVEEMTKRKAANHYWQTYAWSRGLWSKSANIHQFQNGKMVAGIQVDLDESFGNEGWWDLNKPAVNAFSDVPATYWNAKTLKRAKAIGLISGYPDGTFKPDAPATRAEMVELIMTAMNLKGGS